MKILVTGATGLIGAALCRDLAAAGDQLVILSRRSTLPATLPPAECYVWQPELEPAPAAAFAGVDAVIHLAGENVAGRWTAEHKRRIRDSRVLGTRNLVLGMQQAATTPRALIASSAVGYYGDGGDQPLNESAPLGRGFLAEVCEQWEHAAEQATACGARVVKVRTGAVLSLAGGALKEMLTPFRLGVGGRLGDGRQWFPWIHLADSVGVFCHALRNEQAPPVLNGVAPNPVTNAGFTKELAAVLHRPAIFPVPEFALSLLFGEMASVVMASQRVLPEATVRSGYQFRFPFLRPALEDLLASAF